MRGLREYEHVAQTNHFCDHCLRYIHPGEMYRGIVYAEKRHGLWTRKVHISPSCPDPDDDWKHEEELLERMIEHDMEQLAITESALPVAA